VSGCLARPRATVLPHGWPAAQPSGPKKVARTPAPLAHLNGVLPCALRRGRTRRPSGQAGSNARAAAAECRGALLWRYGHIDHSRGWCEVAHGRCNGRSCTYSSGPETFVPLSPTHGPSVCTWRHYRKLIVTSVFNICRPGDAVVSGPRETRQAIPHTAVRTRNSRMAMRADRRPPDPSDVTLFAASPLFGQIEM
jgi:hypothetical protein